MATFGVDNFYGELSVDGETANFHFWDPNDIHNVQDVSVAKKDFPEATLAPDSREVSDYAYSLVADKLNAVRSDRIKTAETERVEREQEAEKAAKAVTSQHLATAQDNTVTPAGTEVRDDGVKQTVYNTAVPREEVSSDTTDSKDNKKK